MRQGVHAVPTIQGPKRHGVERGRRVVHLGLGLDRLIHQTGVVRQAERAHQGQQGPTSPFQRVLGHREFPRPAPGDDFGQFVLPRLVARQGDVAWHSSKCWSHVVFQAHNLGGHSGISRHVEGFVAADKGLVAKGVFFGDFFRHHHGHLPAIVHSLSRHQGRRGVADHRVSRGHKREHRRKVIQDREGLQRVCDVAIDVGHFKPSDHLVDPHGGVFHEGVAGGVKHRRARVRGLWKRRRQGDVAGQGEVLRHEGEQRWLAVHVVHQELSRRRIPALV